MTILFFRTIVIYTLLSVTLRIMGKRQVGELEVSELVSTLLLSEIASLPIENPETPFLFALVPILFIFSVEIVITYLKNKYEPLKRLFESRPVFLIVRGEILQKELLRMRISINEFFGECRLQGVSDLSDIEYAVLEQNGSLSLLLKNEKQPLTPEAVEGKKSETMHPVILDGYMNRENMRLLKTTDEKLRAICKRNHCTVREVFLMTLSDSGEYRLIKKDVKKERK